MGNLPKLRRKRRRPYVVLQQKLDMVARIGGSVVHETRQHAVEDVSPNGAAEFDRSHRQADTYRNLNEFCEILADFNGIEHAHVGQVLGDVEFPSFRRGEPRIHQGVGVRQQKSRLDRGDGDVHLRERPFFHRPFHVGEPVLERRASVPLARLDKLGAPAIPHEVRGGLAVDDVYTRAAGHARFHAFGHFSQLGGIEHEPRGAPVKVGVSPHDGTLAFERIEINFTSRSSHKPSHSSIHTSTSGICEL